VMASMLLHPLMTFLRPGVVTDLTDLQRERSELNLTLREKGRWMARSVLKCCEFELKTLL